MSFILRSSGFGWQEERINYPVSSCRGQVELQKLPEGTLGTIQVLNGVFRFYKTDAAEGTGLTPPDNPLGEFSAMMPKVSALVRG